MKYFFNIYFTSYCITEGCWREFESYTSSNRRSSDVAQENGKFLDTASEGTYFSNN